MTFDEFKESLTQSVPPAGLSRLLTALWHDARGDWERAHHITQDIESAEAAWLHAYLHRKEGDAGNARYWYQRAAQPPASDSLDSEWERLVRALLA